MPYAPVRPSARGCPQCGRPWGIAQPGELGVNEMMLDHLREVTEMMLATICPASGIWRGGANPARPSEGLTQQSIGDTLGVADRTVGRDLNRQMSDEDEPPAPVTNS